MSYYNGKRDRSKTRNSRLVLGWAKKLKAIGLLGGKCSICEEARSWLLEFHHNTNAKEYEISFLKHLSWERLEKELCKCVLICRNCHGDIHFKEKYLELEDEIKTKKDQIKPNCANKIDHSLVLDLNLQGFTQAKIAKTLNCGISTVCDILKSNGIHTFEKKKVIDPLEVIRLRESGLTNVEIGRILGVHRFTVPKIIKRWKDSQNDSINTGSRPL